MLCVFCILFYLFISPFSIIIIFIYYFLCFCYGFEPLLFYFVALFLSEFLGSSFVDWFLISFFDDCF